MAWLILIFVLAWIINAYLGIKLQDLVKAIYHLLSWYVWIFILLGLAIFFLLFLIDGARRLHERTVSELKAKGESQANNIEYLSAVAGSVTHNIHLLSRDREAALEMLPSLAEQLNKALYKCYGLEGPDKFKGEWTYTVTLPDSESERIDWLWRTKDRLSDLIEDEKPESDAITTRVNAPPEAYMS
jgi:hypothetical protein